MQNSESHLRKYRSRSRFSPSQICLRIWNIHWYFIQTKDVNVFSPVSDTVDISETCVFLTWSLTVDTNGQRSTKAYVKSVCVCRLWTSRHFFFLNHYLWQLKLDRYFPPIYGKHRWNSWRVILRSFTTILTKNPPKRNSETNNLKCHRTQNNTSVQIFFFFKKIKNLSTLTKIVRE